MARTWYSVTVELLGGRGADLWPCPGRTFAVGPSHTFLDLADAVNIAFARWDHSHLSMFTLADGTEVTDTETAADLAGGTSGPIRVALDIATAKVARELKPGASFRYLFDFGDDWTHSCTVDAAKIDPVERFGIRPSKPLPYWGWGTIPDQYGRRWADDDGRGTAPRRPREHNPMLSHRWPEQKDVPSVDLREVADAIAALDADRYLRAVTGCDIDHALHEVGAGVAMALQKRRAAAEPVALSLINRLFERSGAGDRELAEELLTALRKGH